MRTCIDTVTCSLMKYELVKKTDYLCVDRIQHNSDWLPMLYDLIRLTFCAEIWWEAYGYLHE